MILSYIQYHSLWRAVKYQNLEYVKRYVISYDSVLGQNSLPLAEMWPGLSSPAMVPIMTESTSPTPRRVCSCHSPRSPRHSQQWPPPSRHQWASKLPPATEAPAPPLQPLICRLATSPLPLCLSTHSVDTAFFHAGRYLHISCTFHWTKTFSNLLNTNKTRVLQLLIFDKC